MEISGQLQVPVALIRGEIFGIHWIGGGVGPTAGLNDLE
jgi:hypothetical protein